jgi:hypothetical protein
MNKLTLFSIPFGIPLLLLAASVGAAAVMYRFTNEHGDPVYSYTLPPSQAAHGYQKIDPHTGQVLESVAAQLPPDELAEKVRREQVLEECRNELDRIYNLYGSERDIDRALEHAIKSLDTRIDQLQANLRQARREQSRLQSQAADAERAGRELPRNLLRTIDGSRSQIETLSAEIEQRLREQDQARARYARETDRFRDGTCPEPGAIAEAHTSR